MTAALELREVSKTYGSGPAEVHALRSVSLTVDGGELVAIMGPSGSGKSTLLTIAGTLEEATSGSVHIDGSDVGRLSKNDRARMRRRSIGYVFQDFNLLAGLTAVENVDPAPGARRCRPAHGPGSGPGGPGRLRPGRQGGPLSRRALRRRAAAGGDRPGGGR